MDEQETQGDLSDDDSRLDDDDLDESEDDEEDQRFLLKDEADLDVVDGVAEAVAGAVGAATAAGASGSSDIYPSFDPETQAKLEDLFETAGFGKLSGETKQFTDPEVRN